MFIKTFKTTPTLQSKSAFQTPKFGAKMQPMKPIKMSQQPLRFFAEAKGASETKVPTGKLQFTFACPHRVFFQNQLINQVKVPGISGEFGILSEHVPTIAEMKPGSTFI
jgi:hypothetical protein